MMLIPEYGSMWPWFLTNCFRCSKEGGECALNATLQRKKWMGEIDDEAGERLGLPDGDCSEFTLPNAKEEKDA